MSDTTPETPAAPAADSSSTSKQLLSNKAYDIINKLVTIILPAVSTFYFAISGIWGIPDAEKVIGSIAALTILLSALLKLSNKSYEASGNKYDGNMIVTTDVDGPTGYSLELNGHPAELQNKDAVTFKVQS